ncbi:phosphonate ABC transporter, permease protein PhnE [Bradyrhizobium sp. USDA 336]|uniref:phosphonate ABC transporter, permease protein PhnE n=1 Tax=Bradyrhizobium sp. USDA 336 TaxID=3156311 RepID=UPI003834F1BF
MTLDAASTAVARAADANETRELLRVWSKHRSRLIRRRVVGALSIAICLAACAYLNEVNLAVLYNGLPDVVAYFARTGPTLHFGTLSADLAHWFSGAPKWLRSLGDTIIIALVSTAVASIAGLLISLACTPTLSGSPRLSAAIRTIADITRSIPELLLAMIFVYAFGIGPLAGVLALSIHSSCVLATFFSEANENVSLRSLEGVQSAGANRIQTIAFEAFPQVSPLLLSYSLFRFEVNIRGASIIGFVGAGGIGQDLLFAVRQFYYTDISAIVTMLLATVVMIDVLCTKIRHSIIGRT